MTSEGGVCAPILLFIGFMSTILTVPCDYDDDDDDGDGDDDGSNDDDDDGDGVGQINV